MPGRGLGLSEPEFGVLIGQIIAPPIQEVLLRRCRVVHEVGTHEGVVDAEIGAECLLREAWDIHFQEKAREAQPVQVRVDAESGPQRVRE
eukprot:247914-Amphidinium_carterae.2